MSHARGSATRLSRVARKAKFPEPDQAHASCPVPPCKNISLRAWPKSTLYPLPSRPTEGRIAIVTDAGRDAVDAGGAEDEGAGSRAGKAGGPDASTPASSRRKPFPPSTVTKKPDHRGEHEGNR